MGEFRKNFPLLKVEESSHLIWGRGCTPTVDAEGEIADYPGSKQAFREWSEKFRERTEASGQEKSLGNCRLMHGLEVAGKVVKLTFDDTRQEIWVGVEPATEEIWDQVKRGIYTAYSIGGRYAWKRPEGSFTRYCPIISEISLVDAPSNPDCTFEYLRADGARELRKFMKKTGHELLDHVIARAKESAAHNRKAAELTRTLSASLSKGDLKAASNVVGQLAKLHDEYASASETHAATVLQSVGSWNGSEMGIDSSRPSGKAQKLERISEDFFERLFSDDARILKIEESLRNDCGPKGGL